GRFSALPLDSNLLVIAAEAHTLPQDRVGIVLAQQIGQATGAMSKDEAMDVDVVLHYRLKGVERLVQRRIREWEEQFLGLFHVSHAASIANRQAAVLDGRFLSRVHLAERLLRRAAEGLNLCRVS